MLASKKSLFIESLMHYQVMALSVLFFLKHHTFQWMNILLFRPHKVGMTFYHFSFNFWQPLFSSFLLTSSTRCSSTAIWARAAQETTSNAVANVTVQSFHSTPPAFCHRFDGGRVWTPNAVAFHFFHVIHVLKNNIFPGHYKVSKLSFVFVMLVVKLECLGMFRTI